MKYIKIIIFTFLFVLSFSVMANTASYQEVDAIVLNEEESYKSTIDWKTGYVVDDVNIKSIPTMHSSTVYRYQFNSEIIFYPCNEEFSYVKLPNGSVGYVENIYVIPTQVQCVVYEVPHNSGFKSYMSYKTISDTTSKQFQLQRLYSHTGQYGIRQVNDRYCIAVGTGFNAAVGAYIDLVLENGTTIPCVVGDIKADIHTQDNNIVTKHNGCLSEFIVDVSILDVTVKKMGNMSFCTPEWDSSVDKVKVYDKNVLN